MENFVNTDKYYLKTTSKDLAKKMIVKNHYSHAWTMCTYALGVFEKKDTVFFDGANDNLIGVLIYGYPVGRKVVNGLSKKLETNQVLELTRLWIADGHGKNIESWSLGQSFKWLKENDKNIKVLVSYADPSAGHLGKIYQATNWMYVESYQAGNSLVSTDKIIWKHPRTMFATMGSSAPQTIANEINQTLYAKRVPKKIKYVYFLSETKKEKKYWKNEILINNTEIDYEKSNVYNETIITYTPEKINS